MVEVRPGSKRRSLRGGASLCALMLLAGCASPDGVDFGPDRSRHRELMAAQRARRDMGQDARPVKPGDKLREGDHLRSSGDAQRALFRYLEAHRLDPMDPTARERIAYIHLEDDPDRARAIFEDVLGEDPSSVNAHMGLGLAQLALGRLELARASLETARRLDPNSAEVLSALGSIYDRMGFHEQARAELDRARALRPHDARVLNNLGIARLLAGDKAGAEMALREAVLLDPRDRAARNNLGLVLGLREQYDDALASFREAGSEQAAQNNLGYCYFLNGRYPQAISHYEKALMADGDDDLIVLRNLANARNAESEGRVTRRPEQPQREETATEPLTLTHQEAAEATPEPETPKEASPPEEAATEPLVFTNRDVEDGITGARASREPTEAASSEAAAPEAVAAPEVAEETPQPATAPSEEGSAPPEPIVLLSEVIDATPSAEAEPTASGGGAETEDAPAGNEAAEEAEESEDAKEAAEPAEERLENALSDARPEEATPKAEPAAPAP